MKNQPDTRKTNLTFEEVKQLVKLEDVLLWLGISFKKRGREISAACPLPNHGEKTASFTVGGKKVNQYYCFGCGGKGDAFDLCEILLGLTKRETLFWLIDRAGLETNVKKSFSNNQNFIPPKRIIENSPQYPYDAVLLDEVYNALLEKLSFTGWAAGELARRGLSKAEFFNAGYRSLPSSLETRIELSNDIARRFNFTDQRTVPGFFQFSNKQWCFAGDSFGRRSFEFKALLDNKKYDSLFHIPALIFPSRSGAGKIQLLKIRNPLFPHQKAGISADMIQNWKANNTQTFEHYENALRYYPPKYQVVSSVNRLSGCSAVLQTHISKLSPFSPGRILLTEGEFKGDAVAHLLQVSTSALAGVNLHHDKFLAQLTGLDLSDFNLQFEVEEKQLLPFPELQKKSEKFDFKAFQDQFVKFEDKTVVFAFDRDNSVAVTQSLLKFHYLQKHIEELRKFNFLCLVWDEIIAKGLDDLLLTGEDLYLLQLEEIFTDISNS
jgi:CHC2 zinc finger